MKVHTHNKKKVQEILDNIIVPDEFGGHKLQYRIVENYFKFEDLTNEDYFDLPEFN